MLTITADGYGIAYDMKVTVLSYPDDYLLAIAEQFIDKHICKQISTIK